MYDENKIKLMLFDLLFKLFHKVWLIGFNLINDFAGATSSPDDLSVLN